MHFRPFGLFLAFTTYLSLLDCQSDMIVTFIVLSVSYMRVVFLILDFSEFNPLFVFIISISAGLTAT